MQRNIRQLPLRIDPGETVDTESIHQLANSNCSTDIKTGGTFKIPPKFKKVTSTEELGPIVLDRFYISLDGSDLWPIYTRIHEPTCVRTLLHKESIADALYSDIDDIKFLPDLLFDSIWYEVDQYDSELYSFFTDLIDSGAITAEETCNLCPFENRNIISLVKNWNTELIDYPPPMFNTTHPVIDQVQDLVNTDLGVMYEKIAYDPFTKFCLNETVISPKQLQQFGRTGIPKEAHLPPIPFNLNPRDITAKIHLDDILQKLVIWVSNLPFYEVIFKYTLPIRDQEGKLEIHWASKRSQSQVLIGDPDIYLEQILAPWEGKVKHFWIAKNRDEELFLLLELIDGKRRAWYIDIVLAILLSPSIVRY